MERWDKKIVFLNSLVSLIESNLCEGKTAIRFIKVVIL